MQYDVACHVAKMNWLTSKACFASLQHSKTNYSELLIDVNHLNAKQLLIMRR